MHDFATVGLPVSPHEQGVEATRASIAAWIASDAFRAVLDTFGGPTPSGDLRQDLADLDDFSFEAWDFRKKKERNLADDPEFEDPVNETVLAAAHALGLVAGGVPRRDHYDHVLVLGGLVRACVLRPRLARRLLDSGMTAGQVTGLGAFRPLKGDELELIAHTSVPDAMNEVEAMTSGMRDAFGLHEPDSTTGEERFDNPHLSWRVARFDSHPPITVVAAPTSDPGRRANTPDTYDYWARHIAGLDEQAGSSVLLVTSAIYMPFQHAAALRMLALPFEAVVDTVGVDPRSTTDEALRQRFTPAKYLQEFRAAITAFGDLEKALDERAPA